MKTAYLEHRPYFFWLSTLTLCVAGLVAVTILGWGKTDVAQPEENPHDVVERVMEAWGRTLVASGDARIESAANLVDEIRRCEAVGNQTCAAMVDDAEQLYDAIEADASASTQHELLRAVGAGVNQLVSERMHSLHP